MKISVKKGELAGTEGEAIILALFEGKELGGSALKIDTKSNGLIGELIGSHDFEAKPSQISVIYTRGLLPAKRIVLVGLGKHSEFDLETLRTAFAKAMQHLRALNLKEAATSIDSSFLPDAKDKVAQAVVEGALLGLYQYAPFKTVDRETLKDVDQLTIVAGEDDFPLIEAAVETAQAIARAVYFTRDLVSAPSNQMTPAILAKEAGGIATRRGVSCTVVPASDGSGFFYIHPASVAQVRKFLFGLLGSSPQEAALAKGCLIAIDFLRDEYGIAANDTRHPDVMSEIPWPPEAG